MSEIEFRSTMTAELVDSMGDDASVVRAARVSTTSRYPDSFGTASKRGDHAALIRFLMANRHGSPFEHNSFTFYVECPIFVAREFMRHRIASYNETSGRYREMEPVFYVPAEDRPLVQVGKAGAYEFVAGDAEHTEVAMFHLRDMAELAYYAYRDMLVCGIAREVARMVLPLNLYTSFYVTMNARGLMNFLGLRTKHEGAAYPSFPQREIEMVAERVEALWAERMPATWAAFCAAGRVCP